MSDEDYEELRTLHGFEPGDGDFVAMPEEVTCKFCKNKFTTLRQGYDDNDNDNDIDLDGEYYD